MTPFVIICNGRDGSTFMQTSLDSHPHIVCEKELLSPAHEKEHQQYRTATAFLNARLYDRTYPDTIYAVGFKMQNFHGRKPPLNDARKYLHRLGIKVIHLERSNSLKVHVSKLIADQSNTWVDFSGNRSTKTKVTVDPHQAIEHFNCQTSNYKKNQEDFNQQESITVIYEELLADYKGQMKRIFQFLNVPEHEVKPCTFQQERRPLSSVIKNYPEVCKAFRETRYEKFLEE